ncbi:MAG: hypothetical protein SGI83_11010 [Bacteroidota bacterium]|nr:hypothetical protein [Bacteroidota bacterium]
MKRILISLLPAIVLTACAGKTDKKATPDETPIVNTTADTLLIDKNAAVYYRPDSLQLERWKKQSGDKDFAVIADDWSYYMNTSSEYLNTTTTPVIDASGKKILKFVKADQSFILVKPDTLKHYWGVFLFSPVKEPLFADLVTIEEVYKEYFK